MSEFDLNFLKTFYHVVTLNGFTRAAEKLNVQQPVVSRAVKLLEAQLGFRLIERQKKQVILTREGREVFREAEKLFASAKEISAFARDRRDGPQGDLSFATSDSLAPEIMGTVLRQLHEEHGSLRPIHHAGSAVILTERIRSGALEFGVFFNVPPLPTDLDKSRLATVPFEFVVAKDRARDPRTLVSFIASKEQDDHPGSRLPLFEKYKTAHKSASIVAVSSSSMARKAMALNGLGVTILPRFLVRAELKQGLLKTVHEGDYLLPLYLVERKSSYRSKVKNALLALIKDAVEK